MTMISWCLHFYIEAPIFLTLVHCFIPDREAASFRATLTNTATDSSERRSTPTPSHLTEPGTLSSMAICWNLILILILTDRVDRFDARQIRHYRRTRSD